MARIKLKGDQIDTVGELPVVGSQAPHFLLTKTDLSEVGQDDFRGKRMVLNIFPSLDTAVCAASVRRFNAEAAKLADTVVLCISADLPFAHARFCSSEGLKDVVNLSVFRAPEFGLDYGATIDTGPLRGLLSRAVVILDQDRQVIYTEQVPEITQEPDYDSALAALQG